jgi:hypothetical protein
MAAIPGTILAAKVTTGNTVNTFPVADTSEIRGGHHTVQTLADRDGISAERRAEGMTCYVSITQQEFRLVGGTLNGNWTEVTSFDPTTNNVAVTALTTAWNGTTGVSQVNHIATSGTSGANAAFALAVQGTLLNSFVLAWLGTTLGLAGTGTHTIYLAQIPNSNRADLAVQIQNGLICAFGDSAYGIETFEHYADGPTGGLGELGLMSHWYGTASINGPVSDPLNSPLSFVATDTLVAYTTYGTVYGPVLAPGTLNSGTYWSAAWTAGTVALHKAEDSLIAYADGSVTPGYIDAGAGWSSTGAIL